jgi:hypothetical protein
MNRRFLFAKMAAFLAVLSVATFASAQSERPVILAYEAPPGCASLEAFQELLGTEIARAPNPDRPWRFSVRIQREGDTYEGTLTTESGVRTMTSARCDDLTSAFAVIVAVADAGGISPPPPSPTPVAVPPLASPPRPAAPPPAPEAHARSIEWRLGARPFVWSHGPDDDYAGALIGGLGVVSVEVPGGLSRMMFELGIGAASTFNASSPTGPGYSDINYVLVDTQACLLDVPVESTGLSVLGCLRLGVASYHSQRMMETGGAYWLGPGLRLRWQSSFGLFLEAGAAGLIGTVTAGGANAPIWFEGAVSLGLKL